MTELFAEEHWYAMFYYLLPYHQKLYALKFNVETIIPESIRARNLDYMEDEPPFPTFCTHNTHNTLPTHTQTNSRHGWTITMRGQAMGSCQQQKCTTSMFNTITQSSPKSNNKSRTKNGL